MKKIFLALSVVFLLQGTSAFGATKAKRYPYIAEVFGKVTLTESGEKFVPAKSGQSLVERAVIKTDSGSEVLLELDAQRSLRILSQTEVFMPSIGWDSQQTPLIILREGTVRWRGPEGERASYNIVLSSDLFQFILPQGDYLLSQDTSLALAQIKVFSGKVEFSALNAEESIMVPAGYQSGFQGVLDEGKISYDILLKGKRIPRGQLLPLAKIDDQDVKTFEAETRRRVEAVQKAKKAKDLAKKQRLAEGFICETPGGKLNQCAWVCEGNPKKEKTRCRLDLRSVSCVRYRCNANGDWAERSVLDGPQAAVQCKGPQAKVASCDY